MAYTVLARKYRSQTFADIVGQDPIARTLTNAIKTGRVAHAYLFTGTRGVGKTTMARILAKSLNCLEADGPTPQPCCKCDSCTAINLGEDIDVIEIDGASNNGVDEVRRLRENAIYRPARARFKIYIIDEVHMLTTGAFNALLKTLEEPPSHVKFIFATTEPNKVIPTIQSRCQRYDFANIPPAKIAEQLKSVLRAEKLEYEDDILPPLARMANGSMRDALSLLDRLISTGEQPLTASLIEQFLGQPDSEKIYNLISKVGGGAAAGTLAAIEELVSTGLSEQQIVNTLIEYMRDLLVAKTTGSDSELLILTGEQRKHTAELAGKFDTAAIIYNITALEKLRWTVKNTDMPRALLEASLLRLALSEHFLNVDQLLSEFRDKPSPAGAKKKLTSERTPPAQIRTEPPVTNNVPQATDHESQVTDHESRAADHAPPTSTGQTQPAIEDWADILRKIAGSLGPGTAGLLSAAVATGYDGRTFTLEFPLSAGMQKQMCQSNGRADQIQAVLSEHFSAPVTLKLKLSDRADSPAGPVNDRRVSTRRKNEVVNDPAVKAVLAGLNATITDIEQG